MEPEAGRARERLRIMFWISGAREVKAKVVLVLVKACVFLEVVDLDLGFDLDLVLVVVDFETRPDKTRSVLADGGEDSELLDFCALVTAIVEDDKFDCIL